MKTDLIKQMPEEIFRWLDKQNYQTDYEETGEYKMYYVVDMPKILNDYIVHILQSLPEPIRCKALKLRGTDEWYLFSDNDWYLNK